MTLGWQPLAPDPSTKRAPERAKASAPLHVCHVLLRLGYGGMENGLVTIVNGLRAGGFRHSIVCLDAATNFRSRVADDVPVHCLSEHARGPLGRYRALWRVVRALRPDIVHTRNLATIDLYPVLLAAGVRHLVHSEHGVDLLEIDGSPLKYRLTRRLGSLVTPAYIALSRDLKDWLVRQNGIPARKVSIIVNGVDTERFRPAANPAARQARRAALGLDDPDVVAIGSLGRLEAVKDHENLVAAYVAMVARRPELRARTVLVLGGDGSRRQAIEAVMESAGLPDRLVLPGYIADSPAFYPALDLFVLPSRTEGTSNTILEAMACGLPVVATDVGESARLVADGETGAIVPPRDPESLAASLIPYLDSAGLRQRHGAAGRERAVAQFSLDGMLRAYGEVYRRVAGGRTGPLSD